MNTRIAEITLVLAGTASLALAGGDINPYHGRQEREQVFEFSQKPTVAKQDGMYVIRFASKAACDATVAIVDEEGRIVRHLASGVLGKNAPSPFTQGSLAQEIMWDGKDDRGEPVTAACQVKVGLGLQARLDSSVQARQQSAVPRRQTGHGTGC